jgi:hypothetical protein
MSAFIARPRWTPAWGFHQVSMQPEGYAYSTSGRYCITGIEQKSRLVSVISLIGPIIWSKSYPCLSAIKSYHKHLHFADVRHKHRYRHRHRHTCACTCSRRIRGRKNSSLLEYLKLLLIFWFVRCCHGGSESTWRAVVSFITFSATAFGTNA